MRVSVARHIEMQKATEYKVEDSNVEKIGSAEDKEARLAAAKTEKEWEGAGQVEGIEIWRVENRRTENDTPDFGVKRWPKEEYDCFYKGDSFSALPARCCIQSGPSRVAQIHPFATGRVLQSY